MKKLGTIILLFSLFSFHFTIGQTYMPFVKENAIWKNISVKCGGSHPSDCYWESDAIYIEGDTVIDNIAYKFLLFSDYDSLNLSPDIKRTQLIREDTSRKVFLRYMEFISGAYKIDTMEYILYDFNMNIGDTLSNNSPLTPFGFHDELFVLTSVDSINISGVYRRRFNFGGQYWIEGIGSVNDGFFGTFRFFEMGQYLGCYFDPTTYFARDPEKGCQYAGMDKKIPQTDNSIKVYPNPATDIIHFNNLPTNTSYLFYNTSGKLALSGKLEEGTLNLSTLPKGIYFLKIFEDEKPVDNFKIIKE